MGTYPFSNPASAGRNIRDVTRFLKMGTYPFLYLLFTKMGTQRDFRLCTAPRLDPLSALQPAQTHQVTSQDQAFLLLGQAEQPHLVQFQPRMQPRTI